MSTKEKILRLLKKKKGLDFTGYRMSMIERRINKRIHSTMCENIDDYLEYLKSNNNEFDKLIDVFTINVSSFFRSSLSFEYANNIIIPELIANKLKNNDKSIRIWSAGCSHGEEPYSMAILLNELINKEGISINANIFATDIDRKALSKAEKGEYQMDSLNKMKFGLVNKYFKENKGVYKLDSKIKNMVHFSYYDMLDEKLSSPPASIFGGFDIILCQNLLIYFELKSQKVIFNKLYNAINSNGYLMLGDAEAPIDGFKSKFKREVNCCKTYRKVE